jgi:hypothetical protein
MFVGKHNKLFFAVPQGVKSFELKVAGYLNHPYVKATVRNQQGKIIASNNSIEEPFCFKIARNDCKREIWSLDIETANPKEFALVQQGKSLEGIFAASPERVLPLKK